MDDTTPETGDTKLPQSLDLSALEGLTLGPQWGSADSQKKRYQDYTGDEERGGKRGGPGGQRRDRRPRFERPGVADGGQPAGGAPRGEPRQDRGQGFRPDRGPRPAGEAPRGPRGQGGEERRSEFRGDRGPRRDGPRQEGPRGPRREERAFFQPSVEVQFYPDDATFKALAQAMKNSCRTFELFEIAKLILQKPERFVVVVRPFQKEDGTPAGQLYVSTADEVPFESEEEALNHVFNNLLDRFFTVETVEVEPPKGAFTVISKCGFTGELLGPPNYHKYQAILAQHHSSKLANMGYDRFLSRIESVKDAEVVQQWIDKMKQQTRYTVKNVAEGKEAQVFDNRESARFYLQTHCKEQLVKAVPLVRIEGKKLDNLPQQNRIRQNIFAALEYQRRFPLESANHLRGRLRRLNYSVYKKGSRGISYVCAVKRRFRTPGQTFGDSVQQLIDFIEHHPNIMLATLPKEYLGIVVPEAAPATAPAAEATTEGAAPAEGTAEAAKPATPVMTTEEQVRVSGMLRDLRWLVTEGYVIEFADGKLFAPPPQATPPPSEEHDAEEFPTAPHVPSDAAPAAEAASEGTADAATDAAQDLPTAAEAPEQSGEQGQSIPASGDESPKA